MRSAYQALGFEPTGERQYLPPSGDSRSRLRKWCLIRFPRDLGLDFMR
jgi:hypothetical protein